MSNTQSLEKLYIRLDGIKTDLCSIDSCDKEIEAVLLYISIELDSCLSVLDLFLNPLPEEKIK